MFEFTTSPRIVFGCGAVREAGAAASSFGRRALLVCGRSRARVDRARGALASASVDAVDWSVAGEPYVDDIARGAAAAREAACDVIVAVGGGSVIDAAKAIAALATNDGDVFDYLEVIGGGRPLQRPAVPVVAVPTTAGTGSEVTRNAVLASREHRVKASLRSMHMMPRVAIVDPELTADLPPSLTAATGLDALTQLAEAFVSRRANAMTDALCVAGIPRAAAALPRVYRDGTDLEAREAMSLASLWSGMALANGGLGAVHGFAGPIGGMFGAPHGAVCAALLPHVVAANLAAVERAGNAATLERFAALARLLTGVPHALPADAVTFLRTLCGRLEVQPLGAFGVTPSRIAEIVAHARRASSMKGNPIELSDAELTQALAAAI